jgi:hypothetical protein
MLATAAVAIEAVPAGPVRASLKAQPAKYWPSADSGAGSRGPDGPVPAKPYVLAASAVSRLNPMASLRSSVRADVRLNYAGETPRHYRQRIHG